MGSLERRKLLTLGLAVLLLHSHAVSSPHEGVLAHTDGSRLAQAAAPTGACPGHWEAPSFRLWEFAQPKCEATLCTAPGDQPVSAVFVTWDNYDDGQAREKPVELLIWADEDGLPGRIPWSLLTTTTRLEGGEVRRVRYEVVPPLQADPIWFGHRELGSGPPTSLFDFLPDATQASSKPPCAEWHLQDYGDYLQQVERADPGAPSGALDCR